MTTSGQSTEPTTEVIGARITTFLTERTRTTWDPETDIFASGGVSSLFAMELVVFLEEAFDVEISGRDLRLDNFRTVRAMIELVLRLRAADEDDRG